MSHPNYIEAVIRNNQQNITVLQEILAVLRGEDQ